MARLTGGVCDLCGGDHLSGTCIQSSPSGLPSARVTDHEPQLAYQSLPSWVEVREGTGEMQVVAKRFVPRMTRLGPLMAPHTPHLPHNTAFPLKVCHRAGGHTFLDLSRKCLCNWLSLIPVGTPQRHNLVACQIDDLIYYVSPDNITSGSEMLVWYAPFYQPRVQMELQEVGSPYSQAGAQNITGSGMELSSKSSSVVTPSVAKILVEQDLVTVIQPDHTQDNAPHQLTPSDNRCGNRTLPLKCTQLMESPSTLVIKGTMQAEKHSVPVEGKVKPCIHLAPVEEEESSSLDYIARLTITAAEDTCSATATTSDAEILAVGLLEGIADISTTEGGTEYHSDSLSPQKKRNKNIRVAAADKVKQLSPAALGAPDSPQSWRCSYCTQTYSCLLTFVRHLKAHLLWLVGRIHVCSVCGWSLSNLEVMRRHQENAHATQDEGSDLLRKALTKSEAATEEEEAEEEEEDDLVKQDGHNGPKRIAALPTEPIEGPHNCPICGGSFQKPEYLYRHLRKHSGDFTCQGCLKVFARKESLVKHVCPERSEGGPVSCPLCGRSFLNPWLLEQHKLKHQDSKKCQSCGWLLTSQEAMRCHSKACPAIKAAQPDQQGDGIQLKEVKAGQTEHQCSLCKKVYSNERYLKQHTPLCRQTRKLASSGYVMCEDCGKEFTDATAFRVHHYTHRHPFSCSKCTHRFQTRNGFETHVCEVDQQCDQCDKTFRSVQALNRHAAVHGPPPFTCKSCRRSFYRKESVKRHVCRFETEKIVKVVKEGKVFTCITCGTRLGSRRGLDAHLHSAHGVVSEKTVKCYKCDKKFSRKDALREHMLVHAAPSLQCLTCSKMFKTPRSLEVHSRIHLNIKRFICKYCNKKFVQKSNLLRHEQSHRPRGTVKCQYCTALCSSTSDLKAHLLSHTLIKKEQQDPSCDSSSPVLPNKEPHREEVDEVKEVPLPQIMPHSVVDSPLNMDPVSKSDIVNSQPLCESDPALESNPSLEVSGEELKLLVKESEVLSLKTHNFMNKECTVSIPRLEAKLVQGMVPLRAPELTLQAAVASQPDFAGHSNVFLPLKLTTFKKDTEATISSEYHVSTTLPRATPSPHHRGNSSVFKVTNDSPGTDACYLPPDVLFTSATVTGLMDDAEPCHLGAIEECHATNEIVEDLAVPSSSEGGSMEHFSLSDSMACLYQPSTITDATPVTQGAKVHVLSQDQVMQNVVVMPEPSVSDANLQSLM